MLACSHSPLSTPGKRSASMMEGSPMAKRSRMGEGVENLWPVHSPGQWGGGACGVQAQTGASAFSTAQCTSPAQRQQQQHPNHQHAMRGGDMEVEGCGTGYGGLCDVDMDGGSQGEGQMRYARFPPSSQRSPTHYHKASAVDYAAIPSMGSAMGMQVAEDSDIRTWHCGYGGKSDYY
mmetsp:Transcript_32391/g.81610  ORF Transcript_32391/g.81610 Transcript_32391/m.81610 type:complete len:177 (-) Transcript_32391:210-740(-)